MKSSNVGGSKTDSFSLNSGRITIEITINTLGNDVCVLVTGGIAPHIGAVSLSIARPSLKNKEEISSSTSILTITGHKDDIAARYLSENLAARLNKNVVVICGIHYDAITADEIETVGLLVREASQKLYTLLKNSDT